MDETTSNTKPIEPSLTTVQDYLNHTGEPKDLETALQQNVDLRFMLRAVYNAYTHYRNSMLLWQVCAGLLGGICGGVVCNFIIQVVRNG